MTRFPSNKRKFLRVIYFILFLLSTIPFVFHFERKAQFLYKQNYEVDSYDSTLSGLNSTSKIVLYADSIYATLSNREEFDTVTYVGLMSRIIKQRFYHGLATYGFSENWIAYTLGKTLWSHVAVVVAPNDILKHSEGLCSQQTIVFMAMLKFKKIDVRSVGLGYKEGPGHFLCEVKYDGAWHLHDVTLEPEWAKLTQHHYSLEYYLQNRDSLYKVYQNRLERKHFEKLLEKVEYGKTNQMPARNMNMFQQTTLLATYILPLLFLFGLFRSFRSK